MVTRGACEVFRIRDGHDGEHLVDARVEKRYDRALPLNVISPGQTFGTFETADRILTIRERAPWCVSSGLISAYYIDNRQGIRRVVYDLITPSAQELYGWSCRVIVLPDSVFRELPSTRTYLLEKAWKQSAGIRRSFTAPAAPRIKTRKDRLSNDMVNDLFRHLENVVTGERPAFTAVSADSPDGGPFSALQASLLSKAAVPKVFTQIVAPRMLGKKGDVGLIPLHEDVAAFRSDHVGRGMDSFKTGADQLREVVDREQMKSALLRDCKLTVIGMDVPPAANDPDTTAEQRAKEIEVELQRLFPLPSQVRESDVIPVALHSKILCALVRVRRS
jgi:hypothetical protein